MVNYRVILAGFVALAVAAAPVGAAVAVGHASTKQAMHDCGGQTSDSCPSCDGQSKANCQKDACGVKCCKLVGMITAAPVASARVVACLLAADPQKPPDWQLRPRPPPPRT